MLRSDKPIERARAAYMAICLGEADGLKRGQPAVWDAAIASLQQQKGLVKAIFAAPLPLGPAFQRKFVAAGLTKP